MPTYSPEQIYAAVRALLPELEENLRQQAEGCNYQYIIGEAGEQPPHCPRHHVALKRKE